MRRRLVGGEEGAVLIVTLMILVVAMGIGTALLMTANAQKRAVLNEQGAEGAFSLAEAALNAQIYELSLRWPTSRDAPAPGSAPSLGYPTSCTTASVGTSYCPSTSDFSSSYPSGGGTCPQGTHGDAWSNATPAANSWTTYVRNAGSSPTQQEYFASIPTEQNALPYDATGNGFVWVRAVATVNCTTAVVVSRVSDQIITVPIPHGVLVANGFTDSDNGSKVILNTLGTSSSASPINVRCNGLGSPSPTGQGNCTSFRNGQVSPSVSYAPTAAPASTLSANQLAEVKALAIANGTYYGPNSCPTDMSQLQGLPVYIDGTGCGTIKITGNNSANAPPNPSGFLVVANGQLDFEGTGTYYGVIYAANSAGSSGNVVTLGGNSTVIGGVIVDGNGTINLGSSGNGTGGGGGCSQNKCGDLEYNLPAFNQLQGYAGAAGSPNTFRELPVSQ